MQRCRFRHTRRTRGRRRRIDACECKGESTKADDADRSKHGRLSAFKPQPERKATANFQNCGDDKRDDAADHDSSSADKKPRVPSGPVSSREIGPSPGSTVI